jgi:hypothetical protein
MTAEAVMNKIFATLSEMDEETRKKSLKFFEVWEKATPAEKKIFEYVLEFHPNVAVFILETDKADFWPKIFEAPLAGFVDIMKVLTIYGEGLKNGMSVKEMVDATLNIADENQDSSESKARMSKKAVVAKGPRWTVKCDNGRIIEVQADDDTFTEFSVFGKEQEGECAVYLYTFRDADITVNSEWNLWFGLGDDSIRRGLAITDAHTSPAIYERLHDAATTFHKNAIEALLTTRSAWYTVAGGIYGEHQ